MDRIFTVVAGRIAALTGQPLAFIIAVLLIIAWGLTGPLFHFSDTWQLIVNTSTTIVTFLMVFLIQNSQNRDAAAMQAKLDELIRAVDGARGEFIGIEHMADTAIERIRGDLERECEGDADGNDANGKKVRNAAETVRRLRKRY
ncbi:low affinity iron permease family protein [Sphingomonas sp. MG17]|uniref:Low affinity iron permease family protein n=1 Tax=Sphingomonas tagetis TaxID=2949092 RepID=A0A9X2HTE5_9SPHN|nr:low affinity iron permease family protein [Sphingomonas tagetis]MCP3733174.1 low affinity iron permease family protein [Sphingomonas tagetis]